MSEATSIEAAYNGDLVTLQWLHSKGCPCDFEQLLLYAAFGAGAAAVPIMQWIKTTDTGGGQWTPAALSETLNAAAACGCDIAAAKVRHLLLHFLNTVKCSVYSFLRCGMK
jgi:hypothetical protein